MASLEIQIASIPTTEDVTTTFLQWLFATTGVPTDYNIGSSVRTFSEAVGSVCEIEGIETQSQALQALVYSAYAAFGITPEVAEPSVGSVNFFTLSFSPLPPNVSVFIPSGTLIQTNSGTQFNTTSSVVLVSGTSIVTAPIQSVQVGSATNVASGTITQVITGLSYPLGVINPAPTAGGQDAETASQTLARFTAYVNSLGLCSPIAVASAVINVNYNQEFVKYSTCYDDQTEVLTDQGWFLFSELPWGAKAATLNPNTHELEYQDIEQYHKYEYSGKLVTISGRFIDLAVTPDHDLYIRKVHNIGYPEPKWQLLKSIEAKHTYKIKRDCKWVGIEEEYYQVGDYKIPMDLWLEFLGYYLSEGSAGTYEIITKSTESCNTIGTCGRSYCGYHDTDQPHLKSDTVNNQYTVQISQWKEPDRSIIRKCLEKLPFNFYEGDAGFAIRTKSLCQELEGIGVSNKKYIPEYVKQLSGRQISILIKALMVGDGFDGLNEDRGHHTEQIYHTTSKRLADDFQELVLKIGQASNIKIIDNIGKPVVIKGRGITGYSNHLQYTVSIHRDHLTPTIGKGNINASDYSGFVYCITVPNHIIYVRRSGKTCWAGNCFEPWIAEYEGGDPTPTAGFQVIIDNGSGAASNNLINAVTNYLNSGNGIGYRPAGVPFSVLAVTPVYSTVVVSANSVNPSLAISIQTAVTQAIISYFDSLNFGNSAQLTNLTAQIANATFGQLTSLSIQMLDITNTPQTVITTSPVQRMILLASNVIIN